MNSKIKNLILVALSILCLWLTIYSCKTQKRLNVAEDLVEDLSLKVDHRTLSPETIFKEVVLPKKLSRQSIIPSTVILPPNLDSHKSQQDSQSSIYNTLRDSVAAVEINKRSLKFTFQDSMGNLSQVDFQVDPTKYQYLWVDGQLTAKKLSLFKRIQFKPYVGATYRPLNNLTDIEGGIKLKTQHLEYKVGVNGFYYPRFQKNPGWDVILGIQYEF